MAVPKWPGPSHAPAQRGRRGLRQRKCQHRCCSQHVAGQAVEHGNERAVFCCYCYALSVAAGMERKRLVRRIRFRSAIADAATGAALSMLQVLLSNIAKRRRLLLLLLCLSVAAGVKRKRLVRRMKV